MNRYAIAPIGPSRDSIPNRSTHYFFEVDVVDQVTGDKWRIEGFSDVSGEQAGNDARRRAGAKILELERGALSTEED